MRRFLTSAVDRLDLAGELQRLELRAPALGPRRIVLARGRCVFSPFEAPPGMGATAAVRAARLFAQTSAPFEDSGWVMTRRGRRFGVWWWDAHWVAGRLAQAGVAGPVSLLPDPLAQAPGRDERIVQTAEGAEAQVWRGGALAAASWRRRPFSDDDWRGFARTAGAREDAVPPPEPAVWRLSRGQVLREAQADQFRLAAVILAAVLVGASAYFAAQALRFTALARDAQAEVTALGPVGADPRVEAAARDLVALKRLIETPDPITLLEQAQAILGPYGFEPRGFRAEGGALTLSLPAEAAQVIEPLSVELEASPYFTAVRPRRDGESVVIEMAVETAWGAAPE